MLPIHLLYTFTYLYAMVTVIVTTSNTQVYMAYIFVQGI